MDSVIPFRLLVPTVDEIRPSSLLGIDLPGLPPALDDDGDLPTLATQFDHEPEVTP